MVSSYLTQNATKIIELNSQLFETLNKTFFVGKGDVLKAFEVYNTKVEEVDNSIYEHLSIRAAMFIEYMLKDSWHQKRQNNIVDFLNYSNPKSIIDVGFGTPTKYVIDYVAKNENSILTLADKYSSAFDFAKLVLNYWKIDYARQIKFKEVDLDEPKYLGDFEAYIFQDTIEHSKCPQEFLNANIIQSKPNSWFIFSLPIAPIIPCHYISWDNADEATAWVEQFGLKIIDKKQVFVNPKVDEFAKSLGEISDLMLLTQKT